jgi:hypothetical protein
LLCRLPERLVLVRDPGLVEPSLHLEHGLFGWLQYRVEATQHGHRKNPVTVFPADVEIPEDVVGDPPDEIGDPGELRLIRGVDG